MHKNNRMSLSWFIMIEHKFQNCLWNSSLTNPHFVIESNSSTTNPHLIIVSCHSFLIMCVVLLLQLKNRGERLDKRYSRNNSLMHLSSYWKYHIKKVHTCSNVFGVMWPESLQSAPFCVWEQVMVINQRIIQGDTKTGSLKPFINPGVYIRNRQFQLLLNCKLLDKTITALQLSHQPTRNKFVQETWTQANTLIDQATERCDTQSVNCIVSM